MQRVSTGIDVLPRRIRPVDRGRGGQTVLRQLVDLQDLRDVADRARGSVLPVDEDDQIQSVRDQAHRGMRADVVRVEGHRTLQRVERLPRRIGMEAGHRTPIPAGHGHQRRYDLLAGHFADQQALQRMPQRRREQVGNGHLPGWAAVRPGLTGSRTGLHRNQQRVTGLGHTRFIGVEDLVQKKFILCF